MRTPILLVLLFGISINLNAQDITVQLKKDVTGFSPKNYYISNVVDDRTFKTKLGKISEGELHLPNGEAAGLKSYFDAQFKKAPSSMAVEMHLKKLSIREKAVGTKRQFDLLIGIAYYANGQQIVEYNGSGYAQSGSDALPYVEKLLRTNIINNLKQFDSWLGKNKLAIASGPSVKVNVNFVKQSKDKNRIFYQKDRKLFITDFKAQPDTLSPGDAATLSGIHMNYRTQTIQQQTTVDVTISVFFDKSKSWMKPNGKNTTTLRHEQRHFDITAIKACELKTRIERTKFSPEKYKQQLKSLLYQIQQEAGDMQNEYDEETYHGTAIDEQEAWNKKVLLMLGKQQCFY